MKLSNVGSYPDVALCDYRANFDHELSLNKGEMLHVSITDTATTGWLYVTDIHGKKGLVPAKIVKSTKTVSSVSNASTRTSLSRKPSKRGGVVFSP